MTIPDVLLTPSGVTIIGIALTGLGAAAKTLWDWGTHRGDRRREDDADEKAELRKDIAYLRSVVDNLQDRVDKLESNRVLLNKRYYQLFSAHVRHVYMHHSVMTAISTSRDEPTRDAVDRVLAPYGLSLRAFDPQSDPLANSPFTDVGEPGEP